MIFRRIKPIKYDHIISLGYNCEVSFRIKDFFGKLESYPFTWVYINNQIPQFVDVLKNFDKLLLKKNNLSVVPWGMILDNKYNVLFHTKGDIREMFDQNHTPIKKILDLKISELKSRYKHLCFKFNDLLFSDDRTLFVIKIDCQNGYDVKDIIKFVKKINLFFKCNYKSKKYLLLVVVENKFYNKIKKMNSKYIVVKYVKKFASDAYTDIDGDWEGWNDIFKSVCLK